METDLKKNASKRIKELRIKKGYTMEQLGELVGVSKSTIAKWENGYVDNMRQDKVAKLAELFKVSPTYILGYDETTKDEDKEREERFINFYSQLDDNQKTIIDNVLASLVKKQ